MNAKNSYAIHPNIESIFMMVPQIEDGKEDDLYDRLWHACAGPLVNVPTVSHKVFYFPQGLIERVRQDPNLRERHLGDLQGLTWREAAKLRPEAYQASVSDRIDQEIPGGGESLDQLFSCCMSSLQSIGRKHIVMFLLGCFTKCFLQQEMVEIKIFLFTYYRFCNKQFNWIYISKKWQ